MQVDDNLELFLKIIKIKKLLKDRILKCREIISFDSGQYLLQIVETEILTDNRIIIILRVAILDIKTKKIVPGPLNPFVVEEHCKKATSEFLLTYFNLIPHSVSVSSIVNNEYI